MSELRGLLEEFAVNLGNDLTQSMLTALGNDSATSLTLNPSVEVTDVGFAVKIIASDDYWYYIENGRKPGKQPPIDKLNGKWQAKKGISPSQVVYDLTVKYNQSKGLKRKVKKLSFDKAGKTLGFLIRRKIGLKGVKPRPFIDRVINDGRVQRLSEDIAKILGKEFILKLNGNN